MDSIRGSGASLAARALEQLGAWPALNVCRAPAVGGDGLAVDSRQIVHLHRTDEAEVYLTQSAVARLRKALVASGRVEFQAGSGWVKVRLECDSDVSLLASLVSVAIKANTRSE